MTSPIRLLADRSRLWLWNENVIGEVDSIPLVSICEPHDDFVRIITKSIELIRHYDHRRYKRVIKYVSWLVNDGLHGGAYTSEYQYRTRSIQLDFDYDRSKGGMMLHAAYYAGLIVSLATHGKIHAQKIDTNHRNRLRKAKICQAEKNRFLERLLDIFPELPSNMIRLVDPDVFRNLGFFKRNWRMIIRCVRKNL